MKRLESHAETAFPIHDEQTAPEQSRETLRRAKAKYGFVPNLLGELAESPPAVQAYTHLQELLGEGRFTPGERQVLFLTVSAANSCEYCVAAHSAGAKMERVSDQVIAGIRNGTPLPDARLEALRRFTQAVVEERGWIDAALLDEFLSAGFEPAHVFEVLVAVATMTLSNYANHILETPLDRQFVPFAWEDHQAEAPR